MDDVAYRAALACLPEMSAQALPRLISLAGSARGLWEILERGGERAAALVGSDKAELMREACRLSSPAAALKALERQGIRAVSPNGEEWPERLQAIYDPPAVLFTRGGELPRDEPCVAVVGSRRASSYGRWAAEAIGYELAGRGAVVVSGAAYGVDGCAHLGCLKAGGRTVAVLGCGVDRAYPREHARLLQRIADNGCVVSEYPPGSEPLPWRFPHRNRIIAGLSHAVVVIEASERSGALITAEIALEEGREVMAVPGPITSPLSRGANSLIQRGAKLVAGVGDIIEELPYLFMEQPRGGESARRTRGCRSPAPQASAEEAELLELLQGEARSLDWLTAATGRTPAELLPLLTAMSLRGWVGEEDGGRFCLLSPSLLEQPPRCP